MSKSEGKRTINQLTDSDASADNSDGKRQRGESPTKDDGSGPSNSFGTQVYGGQANEIDPFAAFRSAFLKFEPGGVGGSSSNGAGGVGGVGGSSSNGAGGVGGVGGSSSNGAGGFGGVGGSSSNGAGGFGGFAGGAEGLLNGNGGVAGALNGNGGAGGGGFSRRSVRDNLAPPPTTREARLREPLLNHVLSDDGILMMQIIASGMRSGEVTPPKANNSLETAPATSTATATATAQSPAPAPSSPGADEVGEAKQGPAPS